MFKPSNILFPFPNRNKTNAEMYQAAEIYAQQIHDDKMWCDFQAKNKLTNEPDKLNTYTADELAPFTDIEQK